MASSRRPSIRSLAKIAGVCPMTVSLSLRNHPSIPEVTRKRIREIAETSGYTPDPIVGRLMRHLRTGAARRESALVCALGLRFAHKRRGYAEEVLEGAKRRAEQLGFLLDRLWLDETGLEPARLKRLLRSRGVEAVLLLPMAEPLDLSGVLDWTEFSAVATSATILAPRVHAVLPDQFGNMLVLCAELRREGARRIGLVTARMQDARVGHRVAAAALWHNYDARCPGLTPLLLERWAVDPEAFRSWREAQQPDVIIGDDPLLLDQMRGLLPGRERAKVRLVCTSLPPGDGLRYGGIQEDAQGIGAAAIEQLDWMYQRGERGIPARPRVTLVAGHYRPAPVALVGVG
jgi:LacI family transcriptional regulator